MLMGINKRDYSNFREMVKAHEGYRSMPYRCSAGKLTIGWGHNLDDRGITQDIAEAMLTEDINVATEDLDKIFPRSLLGNLSWKRYNGLRDMMFQLGYSRFTEFEKMIAAIKKGDWILASAEAMDSRWYNQCPIRAAEIVRMLQEG